MGIELKYIFYQIEGIIMFVPNILIVLTVANQNALRLRKEYLLLAAQALVDSLQGTSLFGAGLYRTIHLYNDRMNETRTLSECLYTYFNTVWLFSDPLSALMLAAISCDRLIAVTKPLQYMALGRGYACAIIGTLYGAAFVNACVGHVFTYLAPDESIYGILCATSWAVPADYYAWWKSVGITGASVSVGLYVLVLLVHWRKQSQAVGDTYDNGAEKKMQRKLTNSLAITTAATFFLYVIPMVGVKQLAKLEWPADQYLNAAVACYMVTQANCVLNLAVYYKRLAVIRVGLQNTVTCKGQMPMNLALVANTTVAHPNKANTNINNK